jgi:hypothetical protein
MAKLLCSFSHHHDSDKSPWRAFVESEADALEQALQGEWGLVLREPAADVLARAKAAGPDGTSARTCCQGDEDLDEEDGDAEDVVVWWEEYPEKKGINWGVGVGSSLEETDKRDSVWLHVEGWEPDPERKAELEGLSKDELVRRLLEIEAVR